MGVLNIKDPAVTAKARKLAKLTGKSIVEAVSDALDNSLSMVEQHAETDRVARGRRTDEIVDRFQASIPPDAPHLEEITDDMYNHDGLPK